MYITHSDGLNDIVRQRQGLRAIFFLFFFFQAEDGIRDVERSRGLEMCIRDRTTGVSNHYTRVEIHFDSSTMKSSLDFWIKHLFGKCF